MPRFRHLLRCAGGRIANKFLLGCGRCQCIRAVDGKDKDMQNQDNLILFATPGHCLEIITQKSHVLIEITFPDLTPQRDKHGNIIRVPLGSSEMDQINPTQGNLLAEIAGTHGAGICREMDAHKVGRGIVACSLLGLCRHGVVAPLRWRELMKNGNNPSWHGWHPLLCEKNALQGRSPPWLELLGFQPSWVICQH